MATRSTISIERKNGSVSQIYCHWDGYLEGVGETLVKHYISASKIEELIALGSLSVLGEKIKGGTTHCFETPETGVTIAYARDMDEDITIRRFENIDLWKTQGSFEEYNYIYKNQAWHYISNGKLIKLKNQNPEPKAKIVTVSFLRLSNRIEQHSILSGSMSCEEISAELAEVYQTEQQVRDGFAGHEENKVFNTLKEWIKQERRSADEQCDYLFIGETWLYLSGGSLIRVGN